jgi:hypothetical protein
MADGRWPRSRPLTDVVKYDMCKNNHPSSANSGLLGPSLFKLIVSIAHPRIPSKQRVTKE